MPFPKPFLGLLSILLTHAANALPTADAEVKPYITTAAEYNTECKTCPRSLCTNKLAYSTDEQFNATCWTRGTKIVDGK
jgi:hypothetical protein